MAEEKTLQSRHAAAKDDKGETKPYVLNGTSMFHEGADYGHGDEVHLDPKRGDELAELGVVVPKDKWDSHQKSEGKVDEDEAKAQRDAEAGAAEIEASKVRSAEEARAANNEPAPVRRGRPPRQG